MSSNETKTCFIISPIGDADSAVRKWTDTIFTGIIEPAMKACDYEPLRSDRMDQPGKITTQVVSELLNAPMVLADLTGHNANVFDSQ